MSKTNTMYVQADLNKKGSLKTAWIPEDKAVEGSHVKIKENGEWTDGWLVEKVYVLLKRTHEEVMQSRDAHKTHRDRTDI